MRGSSKYTTDLITNIITGRKLKADLLKDIVNIKKTAADLDMKFASIKNKEESDNNSSNNNIFRQIIDLSLSVIVEIGGVLFCFFEGILSDVCLFIV